MRYHEVGTAQSHLCIFGVEVFGVLHGLLQRFLIVHFEIVVNDNLEFVGVEELTLAFEHRLFKVEHQVANLVVVVFKSILFHSCYFND